jgi:coenzyme F420 hydrogenase subunit beta
MVSYIDKIVEKDLCLGCGLCESISGSQNVKMNFDKNGFLYPKVKNYDKDSEEIIKKICPSTNVVNDIPFHDNDNIWGNIEELYSSFSTDVELRKKGSSGGTISAIASYLLESKTVDAVLQVGGDENDYTRNVLKISKNRNDVLSCASSRYAPALMFDKIIDILETSELKYCFIGKPCDISAIKNLLNVYPKYKDKIKLTIAIICAGLPSMKATEKLITNFEPTLPIKNLVYRGNGWPGFFSFKDAINSVYKMSYNDSWGNVLGKDIHTRCKICPDGIGLQADVAIGDAWETKDGYPDFKEKEGQSLLIVRTNIGKDVVNELKNKKLLEVSGLKAAQLQLMQPYQFNRRKKAGVRALAFMLVKGVFLNFKNLKLINNMFLVHPIELLKEFLGMFKRSLKTRKC